jgi:anti-sigma B factor antagonist
MGDNIPAGPCGHACPVAGKGGMRMFKWLQEWFTRDFPPASATTAPTLPAAAKLSSPLRNPAPAADLQDAHISVTSGGARENVQFLRLIGILNSDTADEFESKLAQFIRDGQVQLVVDMSGVPYVSSRGWGILISTVQAFRKRGGDIRIMGMSSNVEKLFQQTGLSAIFEVYAEAGPRHPAKNSQ